MTDIGEIKAALAEARGFSAFAVKVWTRTYADELIERCERAEEALRPFAALFVHDTWHDTTRINGVTVGNVRAARAALGDQ